MKVIGKLSLLLLTALGMLPLAAEEFSRESMTSFWYREPVE